VWVFRRICLWLGCHGCEGRQIGLIESGSKCPNSMLPWDSRPNKYLVRSSGAEVLGSVFIALTNLELIESDPADASVEVSFQDSPRYDAREYKDELIVLVIECEVQDAYRGWCFWKAGFIKVRRRGSLGKLDCGGQAGVLLSRFRDGFSRAHPHSQTHRVQNRAGQRVYIYLPCTSKVSQCIIIRTRCVSWRPLRLGDDSSQCSLPDPVGTRRPKHAGGCRLWSNSQCALRKHGEGGGLDVVEKLKGA
jgi:hypothetical protein